MINTYTGTVLSSRTGTESKRYRYSYCAILVVFYRVTTWRERERGRDADQSEKLGTSYLIEKGMPVEFDSRLYY
jgi:hypothetical protein